MRIASLLSSATEIVHELGLERELVAISHECDWPPESQHLPRLSRVRFDPAGLSSGEIDAAVRRCMEEHGSVYEVDAAALRDARPDLLLTQAVCEVCAVPTGSVVEAVAGLEWSPRVLSLDAHTLEEILGTVGEVADAAGHPERGEAAVAALRARLGKVRERVAGRPAPRVLALEWLDPPFAPGHWIPEMVEMAGGVSLAGTAGGLSVQVPWSELEGLDPDALLLVPCGYGLEQARADVERARERLYALAPRALASGNAAIGHSAFFSRSGPRVVGGVEALAAWLHPEAARAGRATPGILEPWR
ncbi:MAG TPA: ABC transporter substrate-binding protein [Longimicrobium sp.]|nr:ABC transporter substrate-binding protein [Longimicrobium sp.]